MLTPTLLNTPNTKIYSWGELAEERPFFVERVRAALPARLDPANLSLRCEIREVWAGTGGKTSSGNHLEFWTIEAAEDEAPSGEGTIAAGYMLHDSRARHLDLVHANTNPIHSIASKLDLDIPVMNDVPNFHLWWDMGGPGFRGLRLLQSASEIPPEHYSGYEYRDQFAAYSLESALTAPANNIVVYAVGRHDRGAALDACIIAHHSYPRLAGRHLQCILPAEIAPPSVVWIGSKELTWRTQGDRRLSLTHGGRQAERLQEAQEGKFLSATAAFQDLKGDPQTVAAAALRNYEIRSREYSWRSLLPPEKHGSALKKKAEKFLRFINGELLDLHLPETALDTSEGCESARSFTARIKTLPFYDCYDLVELDEHVGGRTRSTTMLWAEDPARVPILDTIPPDFGGRSIVEQRHVLIRQQIGLDAASDYFHVLNAMLRGNRRFEITPETAPAYISFFCDYVHGDKGSFTIVESPEEVRWRGFYHRERGVLEEAIFPMRVWEGWNGNLREHDDRIDPETAIFVDGTAVHAGALYRSLFAVDARGFITMVEDSPILPSLSTRTYRWTRKSRFLLSTFPEVP